MTLQVTSLALAPIPTAKKNKIKRIEIDERFIE